MLGRLFYYWGQVKGELALAFLLLHLAIMLALWETSNFPYSKIGIRDVPEIGIIYAVLRGLAFFFGQLTRVGVYSTASYPGDAVFCIL